MYKKILSIDTSLNQISIAIFYKNSIDQEIKKCHYNHEKNIITMINTICIRNKIHVKEFEIIVFSNGPGNFTSLRLGIGIAQGLSIPYNIPLIGFSTFKVLAEQAWRIKKVKKVIICIILNKKKYFWAQYQKNIIHTWIGEKTESILDIQDIHKKINTIKEKWNIIGCSYQDYQKFNNKNLYFLDIQIPYAKDLIRLALSSKIENNQFDNININYLINPIFIKNLK